MKHIIVGLGNPVPEYTNTRHNTGEMMVRVLQKEIGGDDFEVNKKINALTTEGKIKKEEVMLVLPQTYMNKSGDSVGPLVTTMGKASPKKAEKLIVIYDDFQLPLGRIKLSWNRSSGGHNGLESVIKKAKTEAFLRIRVGLSKENRDGTAKVPHGEKEIENFILSQFKKEELDELKKVSKKVIEAVNIAVTEGREKAMSMCNRG